MIFLLFLKKRKRKRVRRWLYDVLIQCIYIDSLIINSYIFITLYTVYGIFIFILEISMCSSEFA